MKDRTNTDIAEESEEMHGGGMRLADFSIGCEFMCGGRRWRCTDVGTRVAVAVCLDDHPDDPSWYNGPPYAVAESVFDEYDQEACEPVQPRGW